MKIPTKTHLPITSQEIKGRRIGKSKSPDSKSWAKIGTTIFYILFYLKLVSDFMVSLSNQPFTMKISLQLLKSVTYPARDALRNRLSCAQTESGPASIKRCATTCQIYGIVAAGSTVFVIAYYALNCLAFVVDSSLNPLKLTVFLESPSTGVHPKSRIIMPPRQCCGVLLSFTDLVIYSAPARECAKWLNRPTAWIFNFAQESFQTIQEVWSKQGMKWICLNQLKTW